MTNNSKYLLLVDEMEEILQMQEVALRYFYGGEIVTSRSGDEILKTMAKLGKPELLIAQLSLLGNGLYEKLKSSESFLSIIATSDRKEEISKGVLGGLVVLDRTDSPIAFSRFVKQLIQSPFNIPTHIPIKHKVACEVASGRFDIYLKLSGTNFVKITDRKDMYTLEEAQKLLSKGISEIHIKASDSTDFLKAWEAHLQTRFPSQSSIVNTVFALDCLEQVEKLAKAFGWTKKSVRLTQKIIKKTIEALNQQEKVSEVLKKKFRNGNTHYAHHVGLLCFLTCMICSSFKLEEAREKMIMASLMHDLALDESTYAAINEWNKAQSNSERFPEEKKYRLHPLHAAQTALSIDILPPDVDQIILQHHEAPDGSGFPRGLTANRIHPLAAVFIIAEDIVGFIDDGESLETSLKDFLTWGEERYKQGHFKKIFEAIKLNIA